MTGGSAIQNNNTTNHNTVYAFSEMKGEGEKNKFEGTVDINSLQVTATQRKQIQESSPYVASVKNFIECHESI